VAGARQARQARQHQAHRARADHQHGGAGALGQPVHAVYRAGQRLGEAADARADALRQPVHVARIGHHGFGEPAIHVDAVGAHALAQVLAPAPAKPAGAAERVGLDGDQVPFAQLVNIRAHRVHHPADLVAQYHRRGGRKLAAKNVRVGSANAHGLRADAHLAGPGSGSGSSSRRRSPAP
jgi:hypothetical protein